MPPTDAAATNTVAWRNQNERSGASNQTDLQTLDALKSGITCDHHGFRPQVQAASRLQGIGGAQPMLGAQLSGQLNDRGASPSIRQQCTNQVWGALKNAVIPAVGVQTVVSAG